MSTDDDDGFTRITLRIPRELHTKLVDAAAKKRSTNAEIIARLESTFPPEPRTEGREATEGEAKAILEAVFRLMDKHRAKKP